MATLGLIKSVASSASCTSSLTSRCNGASDGAGTCDAARREDDELRRAARVCLLRCAPYHRDLNGHAQTSAFLKSVICHFAKHHRDLARHYCVFTGIWRADCGGWLSATSFALFTLYTHLLAVLSLLLAYTPVARKTSNIRRCIMRLPAVSIRRALL